MTLSKETSEHRKNVGRKIYQLRKLHGYTQVELADLLGYESTGTISQIETGERGMKAAKILLAAEVFNIPVQILTSKAPIDTQHLKMVNNLVAMLELPTKKRPKEFAALKKILLSK